MSVFHTRLCVFIATNIVAREFRPSLNMRLTRNLSSMLIPPPPPPQPTRLFLLLLLLLQLLLLLLLLLMMMMMMMMMKMMMMATTTTSNMMIMMLLIVNPHWILDVYFEHSFLEACIVFPVTEELQSPYHQCSSKNTSSVELFLNNPASNSLHMERLLSVVFYTDREVSN